MTADTALAASAAYVAVQNAEYRRGYLDGVAKTLEAIRPLLAQINNQAFSGLSQVNELLESALDGSH